ncbi:MAG TPA: nicotinate phosphoribosyltransferase [Methanospirillum sp.]|nr:nicotinate phosphoribosyltransferase [Methanospirillum sp.]
MVANRSCDQVDEQGVPTGEMGEYLMSSALFTDLYELTMAQSLLENKKTGRAVFSMTVRSLPPERNFIVACGLESLCSYLSQFSFNQEDITYLQSLQKFSNEFLEWLSEFRFTGDLYAIPEGRIVFGNEPLVRMEGNLPELQILETLALNLIHHQTVIASKAARIVAVSGSASLIDFGLRRAHGAQSGVLASRASYVAGFDGTSNLEAGRLYNIPVSGTMAHSYILAFASEEEAFRAYVRTYPESPVLLIDTFDTLKGADLAASLADEGLPLAAVRIDSGDISTLVPAVRTILDSRGHQEVRIIVSGGVDESDIERWNIENLPIDGYGIGTRLLTSSDNPYLDMTYKLVEYEGIPRFKTSTGKVTVPGSREIRRVYAGETCDHDLVVPTGSLHHGELLIEPVMQSGTLIRPHPSLETIRRTFRSDLIRLSTVLQGLDKHDYDVRIA